MSQTNAVAGEAAQNTRDTIGANPNVEIHFKTIDHIKGYPLYQQTKKILKNIALTRVLIANTKPTVEAVVHSKPAELVQPVTNVLDNVANTGLNLTEKVIPSIKTKTYQRLGEEAMMPVNFTKRIGHQVTYATYNALRDNVYQPVHNQVKNFRGFYNKYVDTKGKPIVRGLLDPILRPLNNRAEQFFDEKFPRGKLIANTDNRCCEVDRSLVLTTNFIGNMIPLANKSVVCAAMLPCQYAQHTNQVLNSNLDKQPDLNISHSAAAAWQSVRELEKEAIDTIRNPSLIKSHLKCQQDQTNPGDNEQEVNPGNQNGTQPIPTEQLASNREGEMQDRTVEDQGVIESTNLEGTESNN